MVIGHLPRRNRDSRAGRVSLACVRGGETIAVNKNIFILKRRPNTIIIIIIRSLSPDWNTIVRH